MLDNSVVIPVDIALWLADFIYDSVMNYLADEDIRSGIDAYEAVTKALGEYDAAEIITMKGHATRTPEEVEEEWREEDWTDISDEDF